MRIVDLTHPITDGMPVYPGDPEVSFELVQAIQETGYNVTRLSLGTHTGTHVDVPHHVLHDDHGVDSLSLDALVGWAEVLDLGDLPPGYDIVSADLDKFTDRVGEGARVLLKTGWSKRFGKPEFFTDFPGISEGAAAWVNARKVKLLGIEQPSVHSREHREVHRALLVARVALIESLANLDQLTQERVFIAALPLNLTGSDGAPMRVIAIDDPQISQISQSGEGT